MFEYRNAPVQRASSSIGRLMRRWPLTRLVTREAGTRATSFVLSADASRYVTERCSRAVPKRSVKTLGARSRTLGGTIHRCQRASDLPGDEGH